MADPLTGLATLGAISAVLQVIDFSAKVITETKKLLDSSDDALRENIVIERLTLEHSTLADRLISYNDENRPLDQNEQAVDNIARECKQESAKLLKQMDELKIQRGLTGARKVWNGARKTAKALQKHKAIEQKQRYLSELRNQLSTTLLHIMRITQFRGFEKIVDQIQDANSRNAVVVLESKDTILKALKAYREEQEDSINRKFSKTFRKIDKRLAQRDAAEKNILILDSLRFPEMCLRRNAIPRTYRDTFDWIFEASSRFRIWLSSEDDIFWVCGKAGSGKSTLMKFISSHEQTYERLKLWAGEGDLVLVDSYLWNPGTALQRNEQGMLQEILYRILNMNSDLVEVASPSRWDSDLVYLRNPDPWSRDELAEALQRVLEYSDDSTHYCFFIDGLDEYQGEHSRLVATLTWLAKYPKIKIVVSSRPWNVFRNAFKYLESTLKLEDLTYNDIRHYVEGELTSLTYGGFSAEQLVAQIVEKARGVFLWVFLVVRSLREGLEEGDSLSIMRQRVDEFPSDLEDYFRLILSRISKSYKKQTPQALKLASLTLSEDVPHYIHESSSFITFWLLSQGYLDNPHFAFELDLRYIEKDEMYAMYVETRAFLSACCKDFLCLTPFRKDFDHPSLSHVEYLHRTVYDFLENEDMRHLINENVPGHFKDRLLPSQVALARIKLIPKGIESVCGYSTEVMEDAMQGINKDHQTAALAAEYERVAIHYFECVRPEGCEYHKLRLAGDRPLRNLPGYFASFQLYSFITKVIATDPSLILAKNPKLSTLLAPTLGLWMNHSFPIADSNLSALQLLLQQGADVNGGQLQVWHGFLIKAVAESLHWSDVERQHAARVAGMLISHNADRQSKFALAPGMKLSECDGSDQLYSPVEILSAILTQQEMKVIQESMELLSETDPCIAAQEADT